MAFRIASRRVALVASWVLVACGARSSDAGNGGAGADVAADGPCLGTSTATFLVPGIARGIAIDDTFVYTATNDGIVRAPRAGGAVEKLASTESSVALAADATSLYFFGSHPAGPPDGQGKVSSALALFTLPLAGGTPRLFVDGAYSNVLLSDGTNLFWPGAAGVEQLPLAGGARTTSPIEAAATIEAMALAHDAIYLAVYSIATGDGASSGSIRRMPRGGGAITTILAGLQHPTSLALDDARLYFADEDSIGSALLDGTDSRTIARVSSPSVAVDAHAVYYASDLAIVKVDKATGASSNVAMGLQTPGHLAIRGGNVYWANATRVSLSEPNPPYGIMSVCK
jgi:hypothetical protein